LGPSQSSKTQEKKIKNGGKKGKKKTAPSPCWLVEREGEGKRHPQGGDDISWRQKEGPFPNYRKRLARKKDMANSPRKGGGGKEKCVGILSCIGGNVGVGKEFTLI